MITLEDIKKNYEFNTYLKRGNELLGVLGFTDHSSAHTMKVAVKAAEILTVLGYDKRTVELAEIAGYIHDIGNVVNRVEHAQTGAIMSFIILTKMGMDAEEISTIISAVGNHDEGEGIAINPVSAALIIADKTDVRRSRVRNRDFASFDIHDRVNYAVEKAETKINPEEMTILLEISIDTEICSVVDYFEIFLSRMLMCKRAAEFLGTKFKIKLNGSTML